MNAARVALCIWEAVITGQGDMSASPVSAGLRAYLHFAANTYWVKTYKVACGIMENDFSMIREGGDEKVCRKN